MMAASLIVIGFVVLANNWVFVESQQIQVEPNGTIFADVGQRINISCYTAVGSFDRLEWNDKNGSRITENETLRIYTISYSTPIYDYIILAFNPVSLVDSSEYLCYGKSNSFTDYTQVIVNVTAGGSPPYFDQKFEEYGFSVGTPVTLLCIADGNTSPQYTWFDNYGRNMNDTVGNWKTYPKGEVYIPSIQQDQEGNYTCVASNTYGNDSKTYEIRISSEGSPPLFGQKVEQYEFNAGDNVTLHCYAEGNPSPEYNWLDKYGRNMNDTVGNWSAYTNGSLEIYSIQQDQEGNYTCIASNAYGNDSKTYEIRYGYPPRFEIEYATFKFLEGDNVYLDCHAEGYPVPGYTWLDKELRKMSNYIGKWEVHTNGSLTIYSVNTSQAGVYTCAASNTHGNASKSCQVIVESRSSPPNFRQKVERYEFNVGDDVTLLCNAEGYPSPEYNWFDKDGRNMIDTVGNWSAYTNGSLKIYSIQRDQEGNYTCVASNSYGNDSKAYEIRISSTNSIDLEVNIAVREKWQTLVRFTISFKNESVKYPYVIAEFLARGSNGSWQKVVWNYDEEFLITDLKPGTTYDFKFGVKIEPDGNDLWIKNATMTLKFAPYSPLLIVRSVKEDSIEIEFPYQSTSELSGPLMPLYYMLHYVKLRQTSSGSFYEEDCPIDIKVPSCNGRGYVIGGLSSNYYYKIQLHYLLKSGSSDKSEIIVHTVSNNNLTGRS